LTVRPAIFDRNAGTFTHACLDQTFPESTSQWQRGERPLVEKTYDRRCCACHGAAVRRDQGRRNEDLREFLAPVYGWFTEGFNTRDLSGAKALLEEFATP